MQLCAGRKRRIVKSGRRIAINGGKEDAMYKKKKMILPLVLAAVLLAGGCSNTASQPETTVQTGQTAAAKTEYDASAVIITLSGAEAEISGKGASINDGTLLISAAGTYVLRGSFEGQVLIDAGKEDKVQLVLEEVSITCGSSAAIMGAQSDKITITLAEGTTNTVTDASVYSYQSADEDEPNAAIFSKDDLILNGTGSLIVNANYEDGIRSKDDLEIQSGSYQITSVKDAIQGKDSVYIADGEFVIQAGNDAVKSSNDTETDKGYVTIDGGTFHITAADDAFHAETEMTINDGIIRIESCYEGIEGLSVVINGGDIRLYADDDGINAAGGSDETESFFGGGKLGGNSNASITINGGTIYVNAAGDGIDANGSIYLNGGEVYVDGPADSMNGALDYDFSAVASGGTMIAVGSAGMASGFGTDSTQCTILSSFSQQQEAGTELALTDSQGNVLLSYTPEKAYGSIVITSPDLQENGTYTLTCGAYTEEITLDGLSYSNGQGGFGGGGRNGQGNERGGMENREKQEGGQPAGKADTENPEAGIMPENGGEPPAMPENREAPSGMPENGGMPPAISENGEAPPAAPDGAINGVPENEETPLSEVG